MAYLSSHNGYVPGATGVAPAPRNGLERAASGLRRILGAVLEWSEKGSDREMADFLARSGGRLTDNLEREMMQRRMSSNWTVRG